MNIQKSNVKDIVELNLTQKGILFNSLNAEGQNLYNTQIVLEIRGRFNPEVFHDALKEVQRANDAMRSVFDWEKTSKPLQIVLKEIDLEYRYLDFTRKKREAENYINLDREKSIDLKVGVPFRTAVLKVAPDRYILVLTHHNILYDGWSTAIFLKELFTVYSHSEGTLYSQGNSGFKPAYKEVVKAILKAEHEKKAEDYWLQYLNDYEIKSLPKAESDQNSKQFNQEAITFPMAGLSNFSVENEVTKAAILYTAYGILMHKYLNTDDVVYATPISNRNGYIEGLEETMGNFFNTLPFRMHITDDETLLDTVKRVDEEIRTRNEYSGSSYYEIKKSLNLPSGSDLFDSVLAVENYPLDLKAINCNPEFELELKSSFEYIETPILVQAFFRDKLEITFNYYTASFSSEFIRNFSMHLKNILQQIIDKPLERSRNIQYLTSKEKNQLLTKFNPSPIEFEDNKTVIGLFRDSVEENPHKLALHYAGKSLSYLELDKRSDALANYLIELGTKRESLIPICLDRSSEMIIGILGVLKAGAAYVPIDPTYPSNRIRYILKDTKAELLLTSSEYMERLGSLGSAKCIALNSNDISRREPKGGLPQIKDQDLVYVIYTSGTTGSPKGVMNEHKGVYNRLVWMHAYMQVSKKDVVLQKTTFCFDVSFWEIFLPLTIGAKLILAGPEDHKDSIALQRLISEQQITIMHFVPSLLSAFLANLDPKNCHSLSHVICSGEELKSNIVKEFKAILGAVRLYNLYGPTEASIEVTAMDLFDYDAATIPIGKPIANTHIYIVDSFNNLQAVGIPGELLIGGIQVARGYKNLSSLTEKKFIPDPFRAGKRVFKTGDLAKWLPDGTIAYLGRKDDQVKVRGYRIELGEIEAVLERLPSVKQAAVVTREDPGQGRQLIAYIKSSGVFEKDVLKSAASKYLPEYMVPKIYMELKTFPLTQSGKINKKKLPVPDFSTLVKTTYVKPQTDTQQKLVTIWEKVLGVAPIGINSNFFELGGDSIKAIQLMSSASLEDIHFKVRDLFTHQTIALLAENLTDNLKLIREEGSLKGSLPMGPIQQEFFQTKHQNQNHYNQSVLLNIPKQITATTLAKAIEVLTQHHDALRLQYRFEEHTITQSYAGQMPKLITKRASKNNTIAQICQHYQESLDLQKGQIAQFVLIRTGKTENRLFMVVHHLGVDGVSWRIIIEDLQRILKQIQQGEIPALAQKQTSFRQWTNKLIQYAQTIESSQLPYWREVLKAYKPFPQDYSSTLTLTHADTMAYKQVMGKTDTKALLQQVNQAYNTEINDILLSALALALTQGSGRPKVVIALEGHGREELFQETDISRTVGWFTSSYPIELCYYDQIDQLLMQTKDMLRDIPDKGVGFGALRYLSDDLEVKKRLQTDYYSILFNYMGSFDNSLDNSKLFGYAGDSRKNNISPRNQNLSGIAINSMVIQGELRTMWSYDSHRYKASTIETLAQHYNQALTQIIAHCQNKAPQKTRADYGLPGTISNKALSAFKELPAHKAAITDIYPLSPLQEGMLFHSLYQEGALSYVNQFSCDFVGGLEIKAFQKSWQHLIAHHNILRSAIFQGHFDIPVQCVYSSVELPLKLWDFSHFNAPEAETALEELSEKLAKTDLDLTQAPLFNFSLIQLPGNKTRLILKSHHIVWDGWSMSILMNQFIQSYQSILANEKLPLFHHSDYGKFISHIKTKDKEKSQNFWSHYLKKLTTATFLPFVQDNALRNKVFGNTFQMVSLESALVEKINTFAQNHRLTTNTIIQGAWAYLLSQYNGEKVVAFGATVSGRDWSLGNIEEEVGLYINTLPVCTAVEGHLKLSNYLNQIQKGHTKGREEFSYESLSMLQKYSSIQGALFDTLLVFENYPIDQQLLNASSLTMDNIQGDEYTNYALTLGVVQTAKEISIKFDYNDSLIPELYVTQIQKHLVTLLNSMLEKDKTLAELNYITPEQHNTLIDAFNKTKIPYPEDKTIVDLFQEQVRKTPQAIAITYQQEKISYQQLNQKANVMAQLLIEKYNSKPGDIFGILMPKSPQSVIAILAILKTGAAYLPFDTTYPEKRIQFMIKDSKLKAVITNKQFSSKIPHNKTIVLEAIHTKTYPGNNLNIEINPSSSAYVIYTSGSTGQPKGVPIAHTSNVNMSLDQIKTFQVNNKDTIVWFASLGFDASVSELMMALYSGATLAIPQQEVIKDKNRFTRFLKHHNASVLTLPPSYLELLQIQELKPLRCLISAGEAVKTEIAHQIAKEGIAFFNAYGPTECGVCVTTYQVKPSHNKIKNIPIGKPIANLSVYVLDHNLKPLPIGVPGTLFVSGTGLANGYLNRKKLTREKFLENPWKKNQTMYNTGDIVKWNPDGNLLFIGRKDQQVKLRGYRIELQEIKNAIKKITAIKQVEVCLKDNQLVGYIVANDKIDGKEIKKYLQQNIPEHMIPAHFVSLEEIPLTPHGKVDQNKLPEPEKGTENVARSALSQHQKELLNIWADLLKIPQQRINIADSFFSLGGDSLTAIKLTNRIAKAFDIKIPLEEIFAHETLKELAGFLEKSTAKQQHTGISPAPPKKYYPLSPAQQRLFFLYQFNTHAIAYNIPYAVKLIGALDKTRLEKAFTALIQRHQSLRTSFEVLQGKPIQKIAQQLPFKLEYYKSNPKEADRLIQNFIRPFDLDKAPAFRVGIIHMAPQQNLLLLDMHHIITDGVSCNILIGDFIKLYNQEKLPLPKLQYKDYALWQQSEKQQQLRNKQRAFWINQFQQNFTPLNLPVDFPRPAIKNENGAAVNFHLDQKQTLALKQIAQQQGTTLFMVLLACYNILLSKLSGQQDIIVGTPLAGRNHQDLENIVGMFVNTIALRNQPKGALSFLQFLNTLKNNTLACFDHQQFQYESLIDALKLQRDTSRNALFDVLFTLQNAQEKALEIPGLKMVPYQQNTTTAKFDLELMAIEAENNMALSFTYATSLFKKQTVEAFAKYFKNIVSALVENPEISLGKITLLSQSQRQQILSFNPPLAEQQHKTILQRFAQQVHKTPQAIALRSNEGFLSYDDLAWKSDLMAGYLQNVKRSNKGDYIVVYIDRSLEMIIALLAVLKAGAVYVPVDVNLPKKRLEFILKDTKAKWIITSSRVPDPGFHNFKAKPILADVILSSHAHEISLTAPISLNSEDPCYIIYTSGTTANPKGVLVNHGNLGSFLTAIETLFIPKATQPILASNAFDIFLFELCNPLLSGGSAILLADADIRDIDILTELLKQADAFHGVPAFMASIVERILQQNQSHLYTAIKELYIGGDTVPPQTLNLMQKAFPKAKIHVFYGPTETTIFTTKKTYRPKQQVHPLKNLIGKPFGNNQIQILDTWGNLAPIGVTGEVILGGKQVSQGYLNPKEPAQKSFIKYTLDNKTLRGYRTGDMAQWLPDGNIAFIGRNDRQVKIRGYRVELTEIERSLELLPEVKQAVVLASKQGSTKQLLGYIMADTKNLNAKKLIHALRLKLPEYMVPRRYSFLDKIPLTPNGKVDHKALPEVEEIQKTYHQPQTDTQQKLVTIWEKVLGVAPIGINSNFFELGGDSIKAIQLMSSASLEDIHFKVRDLFTHQTIALLAENLTDNLKLIREEGSLKGSLPMGPIQQEFFQTKHQNQNHYNQSVLLNIPKQITATTLAKAIEVLTQHHDALRMQYRFEEHTITQSYAGQMPKLITKRASKNNTIAQICQHYQESLDLQKGQIAQFVLIRTGKTENRLFMVVHHLGVDGVSWRIIIEDLQRILKQIQQGEIPALAQKQTSFRQWTNKLIQYAQTIESSQLPYWREVLKAYKPFPQDYSSTLTLTHADTMAYKQVMGKTDTKALLQQVNQAYNTEINDILLSALALALTQGSGRPKVVIALEGHGREELFQETDISRTVGWFTSSYPIELCYYDQIDQLLMQTKDMLRDIPDKGVGFGALRYLSDKDKVRKELSKPYAQIVFNYLGSFDNTLQEQNALRYASEDRGKDIAPYNANLAAIAINSMVINGELHTSWSYDGHRHDIETIAKLAQDYKKALKAIIAHCQDKAPQKTRADYGLPGTISNKALSAFKELPAHKAAITDIYPLSPLQEGMLFHSLYQDQQASYVGIMHCDFIGGLKRKIFKQTWQHLIHTHSILRSAFFAHHFDVPVQCVYQTVSIPLEEVDLTNMAVQNIDQTLKDYTQKHAQQGFDLKKAPLFCFSLIQLPGNKTRLILKNHHILWDGWSLSILMQQFMQSYQALVEQQSPPNFKKAPYRDYIEHIKTKNNNESKHFWKQYLNNIQSPTFLPFVEQTKLRNKVFGNTHALLEVEQIITEKLIAFTQKHRLTINTLIQGAWGYLLAHYNNSNNSVFGATVSGRDGAMQNSQHGVGLYINTLPVCIAIAPQLKLSTWLKEIQKQHTRAREEFAYTALSDIQKYTPIHGPLFDSLVVFENYPIQQAIDAAQKAHLKVDKLKASLYSNYVLTLGVSQHQQQLSIKFDFNDTLIPLHLVKRIQKHLAALLQSMAQGDKTIAELNYIQEPEKKTLLNKLARSPYTLKAIANKNTTERFEQQVVKTPNQTAVVYQKKSYSYKQLNQKANAMAHMLIEKYNSKPGDIIAILLPRSTEAIIAMIAVLKTGAAYLPIDTLYPKKRIQFIIQDSKPKTIISSSEFIRSIPDNKTAIDLSKENTQHYPKDNLNIKIQASDMAYIIYTSGSTGKPKGVMIAHKAMDNYCRWAAEKYFPNQQKILKIPLFTSLAFDLTITAIFPPLISGNQIIVYQQSKDLDIDHVLRDNKADVIKLTPSHLKILNQHQTKSKIKRFIIGGETLQNNIVSELFNKLGNNIEVYNEYGPTEATVGCMIYQCDPVKTPVEIPIGKPIPNTKIYLLDNNLKPVPIGVEGNLYIAGDNIAIGYLNNKKLSQEKFINNPWKKNEKIYLSGDLARWNNDGNLLFIGRNDQQIKIKGYRIELREINQALEDIPQVKQALTQLSLINGNKEIIAYIIAKTKADTKTITKTLKNTLPKFMLPNHIIPLEHIPLTTHGKVDTKKLPKPIRQQNTSQNDMPKSSIETQLASIWAELLAIDKNNISSNDNFFDLGGDSLKAITLQNKIKKEFNTTMPLDAIFEKGTVNALAQIIEVSTKEQYIGIKPAAEKKYYELSSAQKRLYFLYEFDKSSITYNIHHFARLSGALNKTRFNAAFTQLISRHESLRTYFEVLNDTPVQKIASEVPFTLEHFDLKSESVDVLIKNFIRPFKLNKAPLFRVGLISISPSENLLLLDMHHIVTDGVSQNIMVQDFIRLYNKEELPKINLRYRDYSEWQLLEDNQKKKQEQRHFWLNKFKEKPAPIRLPQVYPRPIIKKDSGNSISFEINEVQTKKLRQIATEEGATLFMVVLSIFKILLAKLSGEEDIVVGTPVAGRQHADLENIVGMFVNTLAFRSYPQGQLRYTEFLNRLKSDLVSCFENQDFQYEELVDELQIARDPSRNALFDVFFTFQNQEDIKLSIPGLTITPYKRKSSISKFDLTLTALEKDDTLALHFEYATSLFKSDTISRFIGYFKGIISKVVVDKEIELSRIGLATSEEIVVLNTFNDTQTTYPKNETVLELFAKIVKKYPKETAVVFEGKHLTYGELDQKSDALAYYLVENGIRKETLVPICTERSLEMIIGIVGILKAGGAYVPIDPDYPDSRIEFILQNTRAEFLLTQSKFIERFNENSELFCIALDIQTLSEKPSIAKLPVVVREDLIYVIYTSGTTGVPKGVMNEHKGVYNRLLWMRDYLGISENEIVLQKTTFCFDVSVWEILLPLVTGSKMILARPGGQMDSTYLQELIASEKVSIMHFVPSMLSAFLPIVNPKSCASLLHVICSGEELKHTTVKRFKSVLNDTKLHNLYGPTEAAIDVTAIELSSYESLEIPIGKPISNTKMYIVDSYNNIQPIGVPGELLIGGVQVARGYKNLKAITVEKFVPNPFSPKEVVYRTGDIGKWLPDGNIAFLGRQDKQVKIRGFRIELGEIENQLISHDEIFESAVLIKEHEEDKYLIAYYVSQNALETEGLIAHLVKRLPKYMIPVHYHHLKSLPINSNGKIDKAQLPTIEFAAVDEYVPPSNETEKVLVALWGEILKIDKGKISVNSNFFILGGHSLMAMSFVVRLHKEFDVKFSLQEFFTKPTIRQIATQIELTKWLKNKNTEGKEKRTIIEI